LDDIIADARNITSKKTPLLLVIISVRVDSRKSYALAGIIDSNNLISSLWKFGIGINGISVNRKKEEGRSARRRLKAMDDALVTSAPFLNPLIKNRKTSYIGTLSNPGSTRFFNFSFSESGR
jgi:hypothetical protein